MLGRLRVARLLAGGRGQPSADTRAVADAIVAGSTIACELGGHLQALDINPLICGPAGAGAGGALGVPPGRWGPAPAPTAPHGRRGSHRLSGARRPAEPRRSGPERRA